MTTGTLGGLIKEFAVSGKPIIGICNWFHVLVKMGIFPDENLIANLKAVMAELNKIKPPKVSGTYIRSVFLAPTMGPSVKVDLDSLR